MKKNYLFTISFNGAAYHGFQVQKNALAIATRVQDAVEALFHTRYDIVACSRTDAGVHANMFCFHMLADTRIPASRLPGALNNYLPEDIAVYDCQEVPMDFHARYSAVGKEYVYLIFNRRHRDPFWEKRALHYQRPLDVGRMQEAASLLCGTHDFSAFCNLGSSVEDKVRTIYSFTVERYGDMVRMAVRGNGFLYHMVRILAGTLVAVSNGRLEPGDMPGILASMDRHRAGVTLSPYGLYLNRVFYEKDQLETV